MAAYFLWFFCNPYIYLSFTIQALTKMCWGYEFHIKITQLLVLLNLMLCFIQLKVRNAWKEKNKQTKEKTTSLHPSPPCIQVEQPHSLSGQLPKYIARDTDVQKVIGS